MSSGAERRLTHSPEATPMLLLAKLLVAPVALLHLYFLVLEMFLWTAPAGRRAFGTTQEFAEASKTLTFVQALQAAVALALAAGR
jgi:uncharacterized membrane protein